MSEEDQDIKWRDQIAMQVLGHLIQADYAWIVSERQQNAPVSIGSTCKLDSDTLDKLARAAYRFADAMRKGRLASFK